MNINYEVYSNEATTQTYGGETWLDDYWETREYGIVIGDVSISGISPKQMVSLATEMVNHLIVNGHTFELIPDDHQDVRQRLNYKGQR